MLSSHGIGRQARGRRGGCEAERAAVAECCVAAVAARLSANGARGFAQLGQRLAMQLRRVCPIRIAGARHVIISLIGAVAVLRPIVFCAINSGLGAARLALRGATGALPWSSAIGLASARSRPLNHCQRPSIAPSSRDCGERWLNTQAVAGLHGLCPNRRSAISTCGLLAATRDAPGLCFNALSLPYSWVRTSSTSEGYGAPSGRSPVVKGSLSAPRLAASLPPSSPLIASFRGSLERQRQR